MMGCRKCNRDAVMHAAYSGADLCEQHFREFVERRVRHRVREDNLIPASATPENPQRWLVGLSGGKDSVVLTTILHETFVEDPRIELVALTIHEGIEGYRDESVDACKTLVDELGIEHEMVSYEEEFDVRMDAVAESDPMGMAPCAYCGVFRRDLLNRHARELDADLILTGHNLDDEAETALMNILEGDVEQIADHYATSIAGRDEIEQADDPEFIPRAKPLREVPEREVALYAHLRGLPAHIAECPHADRSFRGEIQTLLHDLEDRHPGTRHSIMAGYAEFGALAADTYGTLKQSSSEMSTGTCERCGRSTDRSVCRTCELLAAVGGNRQSEK